MGLPCAGTAAFASTLSGLGAAVASPAPEIQTEDHSADPAGYWVRFDAVFSRLVKNNTVQNQSEANAISRCVKFGLLNTSVLDAHLHGDAKTATLALTVDFVGKQRKRDAPQKPRSPAPSRVTRQSRPHSPPRTDVPAWLSRACPGPPVPWVLTGVAGAYSCGDLVGGRVEGEMAAIDNVNLR
jgi:hypothetical protein